MKINIDKAAELAGKPFRLKPVSIRGGEPNFREEFQTGFEYWTRYKADIIAKKIQHRVGFWENNKFLTKPKFSQGGWEETDWSDYQYQDGQQTRNYFKKKMIGLIEFLEPSDFPSSYNSETKKYGVEGATEAYVTITPSLYEKICDELKDPRTNIWDYLVIDHNPKNPPATVYAVRFHSSGKPYEEEEVIVEAAAPSINLFPHEVEILKEVEGDDADLPTLIEYIMGEAEQRGMDGMNEARAEEIATGVLIGGKVTLP